MNNGNVIPEKSEDQFKSMAANKAVDEINSVITEEIVKCIRKVKNNNACGLDKG